MHTDIEERNAEQFIPQITRLVNRLLRAGQRPTVERDDLLSVGLMSVMRDLRRNPSLPIQFLLRNAKTLMFQHISLEKGHWKSRKAWEEMFDDNGREKF